MKKKSCMAAVVSALMMLEIPLTVYADPVVEVGSEESNTYSVSDE